MQRLGGPVIIIAVVAVIIVAAIAGVVYTLFAGGDSGGMTALTSEKNVASHEGLSLSVPPAGVPGDFKVAITSLPAADFESSTTEDEILLAARTALPSFLKPLSPIFTLQTQGSAPMQMTFALDAAGLGPLDTVDLYAWDGTQWYFLPGNHNGERLVAQTAKLPQAIGAFQTASTVQVVSTVLDVGDSLAQTGSTVNVVQVSGLVLQADGALTGGLQGGYDASQGYAVMPLLRTPDDNGTALNAMLADANAQQLQIGGVVDLVNSNNFNGVVIDYRGLDPARGAAFNQFVTDLAAALHEQGKTLTVVVPTPKIENANYTTGAYDLKTLGEAADVIELPLGDDLSVVGNGSADQIISWATGQVSRFKLRLLLSTFSADSASDGSVLRVPGNNAITLFGNTSLQTDLAAIAPGSPVNVGLTGKVQSLDYDTSAYAPRFTYLDDSGQTRIVHFTTAETVAHQLVLSQAHNLGGVTVRNLFNSGNPAGMFDAVVQFKLKNAALTTAGASLSYVVQGANGVVAEATSAPNQPFAWTAGDPGQYSIAANFNGSALGSVDVMVPSPTPVETGTPAPSATATRKPVATATPCSGPCPTATPAPPTNTPAPTQAPAGSIAGGGSWGAFELGGQVVHGGITYAADMKRAGMTWVKLQAHEGNDMSAAINNAHAQGFKILVSVVGAKDQVMNPAYQQQFANYMATLASQGADALEVWNEPNIDREWPNGQVNGANYASLLKTVYPIVKGANPNTIVVSAAPAPTGFFGGDSCWNAGGCDDRTFMQGLFNAGGGNYLDCIGVHYNEGIVSPHEIGTDPRDNYFTRYFQTMINTYAGIFQNARPLCFTEIGYLTGEGYPDLASTAPGFAWAANTSVGEQAQWLAEAASIAKGTSAIRFMIVFNIDFTTYGSDPQAGYAIIRPGGACPACDALDAVMP